MSSIKVKISNRVSVLRAERKLSRQQLADAVNVNVQTIGFLERGDYNPSLALALDLADYFGLPVEAIFSRAPFRPLSEILSLDTRSELSRKQVNQ